MQLITEGINNCMLEQDEEKLQIYHKMLQLNEMKAVAGRESEVTAL